MTSPSRTQPRSGAGLTSYWTLRRIGATVMIRRLELALSRRDLAAYIGVPTATVEAIEDGEYDPRLILAARLEAALAMTPGTIHRSARADTQSSAGRQRTGWPR